MENRMAWLFYAFIFLSGILNGMYPTYQAPNAANQQAYAVPSAYNYQPGSAQPVEYGAEVTSAPAGTNQSVNHEEILDEEDGENHSGELQQPNYQLFRGLEHARMITDLLHAQDSDFEKFINELENWGRARKIELYNAHQDIELFEITLNKNLFDNLAHAYPARVHRINRLRNVVKSIRIGYGTQKFIEKPLLYMGITGAVVAFLNSIATKSLFQWPSTTRKQQEECIFLYNKINEHAHVLRSNTTGNAMRLLVQAKEDLQNYLMEKDYNPHLMELSVEEWVNRKSPDIIEPTNPPYILITYHGNGAVTSQTLFDDETFVLVRRTPFSLDALITYNLSRLQHAQTAYSKEQKELLRSYYGGVQQIFREHRRRLQKLSIQKSFAVLAGSLAVGALWSYYVRLKKVDL